MGATRRFGKTLREKREFHGISMRALAEAADMDPAYLSRIENGKTGLPKKVTVERLAAALCHGQRLDTADCEQLTRQLLHAADHLQSHEELIDDLADQFSARLREEGFPDDLIDEALARVPLATMRKVLLGEEKLEIGRAADYTSDEITARREAGEEVLGFSPPSAAPSKKPVDSLAVQDDSATSYLDRHARDFTAHRRERRSQSGPGPGRSLRAGKAAEIRLHRNVNKAQERQLRLIAKLIESLLEE